MFNIIKKYSVFCLIILMISCMEDLNAPGEARFNIAGDLITHVEANSSFITNDPDKAIMSIYRVVFQLEGNKLYLDIRSPEDYNGGHIEGAVNLKMENLIDTLENTDFGLYKKIVIVSNTGQKAAYAVALLQLYGFTEIVSLDFGMGQWNREFSDEWINARNDSEYWNYFTLKKFNKPSVTHKLPVVNVSDPSLSTDFIFKTRIKEFLTDAKYTEALTTIGELDDSFSRNERIYNNKFIICYSDSRLYYHSKTWKSAPPVTKGAHPISSVLYNPETDFKASADLLTIPTDKEIVIYSYNGQRSAYISAYLRLLGYNAKSLKYGAVSMFYNKLDYYFFPESFQEFSIYGLSFVQE